MARALPRGAPAERRPVLATIEDWIDRHLSILFPLPAALTMIAIVAAVIVLGGRSLLAKPVVFESYFDESVEGLAVGSPVKLRGVEIGRVAQIGFVQDFYHFASDEERVAAGNRVLVRMEVATRRPGDEARSTSPRSHSTRPAEVCSSTSIARWDSGPCSVGPGSERTVPSSGRSVRTGSSFPMQASRDRGLLVRHSGGAPACAAKVSSVLTNSRETCIWLIPICSAISDWVRPSKKRK